MDRAPSRFQRTLHALPLAWLPTIPLDCIQHPSWRCLLQALPYHLGIFRYLPKQGFETIYMANVAAESHQYTAHCKARLDKDHRKDFPLGMIKVEVVPATLMQQDNK
ncbi:uncharacterized protein KRP23_3168 [Phytophthora ramorum]|uniref:uncharacterized protein n=1 Tax=Phytophthora ramorum TaxID=164328 RepID=UPI0030A69AB5|nr:hypothetical protein KRP23_3168 [Phytophthora ramorum]